MKFRRDITVFVRKNNSGSIGWESYAIKKALVTQTLEANSNISAKGLVPNSRIVVRFPPDDGICVTPGDFIYIGGTEQKSPPLDSVRVLSVTGGDRGSRILRLTKAVCG